MNTSHYKTMKRERRHAKIRRKISGTAQSPRLSVFRSNKFIYAQLIDDTTGTTIVSADDSKETKGTGTERAQTVGTMLAKKAQEKQITHVVFDRGGYLFAGRVKALAESARNAGLQF